MEQEFDVVSMVSGLTSDLLEDGQSPLAVASALLTASFMLYAKELSPESFNAVLSTAVANSTQFLQTQRNKLH